MRNVWLIVALIACTVGLEAQRRQGTAALALEVTDPEGRGIPDVDVTLSGPASRTARTEAGRIALEGLPAGAYLLRFEREGFVTLEREVTARAGKPTEVKVTLKPQPAPPEPPAAAAPAVDARPMFADLPGVIEKEHVGRAPMRVTQLACGAHATATLIQLNAPLARHAHDDADEIFYVVAGEGHAHIGTGEQRLQAGIFLFVPRGMAHAITPSGRRPLTVLSARAGEPCRQ